MQTFISLQNPQLVKLLRAGAVGVLPTDTVYGLVCLAADRQAVERLYALKSRERKPGTLIAANTEQLRQYHLPATAIEKARHFWPGPVSVVFALGDGFSYLHQAVGSCPFRIPVQPAVRELLEQTGPLLTTSANLPGQPPATTIAEARTYFGEQVDFYVDGGVIKDAPPSTIVGFGSRDKFVILRQGAATIDKRSSYDVR